MIDLTLYNKLTFDSRLVEPGDVFFAIKGNEVNGELFIADAVQRGAKLIVVDKSSLLDVNAIAAPILRVENIRLELARAAAQRIKRRPRYITAVTGTNGKTSITYFYKQIVNLLGKGAAIFGTTGVLSDIDISKLHVREGATTLDPVALAQLLEEHGQRNIDYICMEASSHGLHQYRLDCTTFDGMAFTNLTPEHQEYHPTQEDYFLAKLRLFEDFARGPAAIAVVNAANPKYFARIEAVVKEKGYKLLSFGRNDGEVPVDIGYTLDKKDNTVAICYGQEKVKFISKLYGEFQISNLCAAIGLVLASGFTFPQISATLAAVEHAVGRMELVGSARGAKFFVDYAHSPDALRNLLLEMKSLPHTRLTVVFGCGGNRAHEKRRIMGEIASLLADRIVVTDDNPRFEEPAQIRAEIISACALDKVTEIGERLQAIEFAIQTAIEGEIVVIAGKGHEKYQIVGHAELPHCDIEAVRQLL